MFTTASHIVSATYSDILPDIHVDILSDMDSKNLFDINADILSVHSDIL